MVPKGKRKRCEPSERSGSADSAEETPVAAEAHLKPPDIPGEYGGCSFKHGESENQKCALRLAEPELDDRASRCQQGVSSNPPMDPQCSSSQQLPFTGAEAQARDEDSVNGCGNASDRNDNRADSDEYEEEEDDDYYGQGYDDLMDRDALAGDSTPAGSDADDCNQTHAAVCLDEEGLRAQQHRDQEEVTGLLGVDESTALLLLRSARWNKEDLLSKYMEDPEAVCKKAGVPSPSSLSHEIVSKVLPEFECGICRGDGEATVTALACGHKYCNDCWHHYLTLKVTEGQTSILCPEPSCQLQVRADVVEAVCEPPVFSKYKTFLLESRVNESRRTVWCPYQDCGLAVDASRASGKFVTCAQKHSFCVECKQEAHAPADCATVKLWLQKCDDDSETLHWLSAHTQDCPKCHSTIEKNGGCNHMTCRKCKHDFCWVCMEDWSKHKDFYVCNRFDSAQTKAKEDGVNEVRLALDRYLFHFHRYMNHDASRKLDRENRDRATKKMEEIQAREPNRAWGDVQFVEDATEGLSNCRAVLKWTYVLAHYLDDDTPEKDLFCFLQQGLEQNTERLSELLESDVEKLMLPATKSEVLALMSVANESRKKLLHGVEEGLSSSSK